MWGHSGGWLSFSCLHGVVYCLKFLLRAESCRDYVDGCLSMSNLPNVFVANMAQIVAKHANRSRREDIEKYNKEDNEGKRFRPYDGRAANLEIKDNVKNANDGTLSDSYPWMPNTGSTSKQSNFKKDAHLVTGSDAHLCLFDKFHERNSSSEIQALHRIGNIPELNCFFNSEIEEQLHLKFDGGKKFLNMMTPITHFYLFRSILNHHKEEIKKIFLKCFENELPSPISSDQFVPSINTKSFINAENDECLKKETIYQTEDESMEESQLDYENNISISTFIEEETEDSNTEMEICVKDYEDLKIATRQAPKVNSERLTPPDDDDVWTHCPNFTFRERSSISSRKPLTDEIMHKVMLKLLYGYNGFNIAGFNKMLYRKHTFRNTYKRRNHPFIQIHELYENNWVVVTDFRHISEIDSDEARSIIYIYDSFLKKSYCKRTNEVRYPLTFIHPMHAI